MDDGEELTLTLPAVTSSIPAGRTAFAEWLEERCDGGVVDELAVVFSELVANAVSASADASDIDVRATHHDGHVFLDVANVPDRRAPMQRWDLTDDLRGGGRGLLIVTALVDDIEVSRRDGVVAVCCRRRVD